MEKLAAAQELFTRLCMMDGTTAEYMAMILSGGQPQPRALPPAEADDGEDEDNGPAPGPKLLSSIELACTPGMLYFTLSE
jgi:hypothetical protein